jgi:hypothetical protein
LPGENVPLPLTLPVIVPLPPSVPGELFVTLLVIEPLTSSVPP